MFRISDFSQLARVSVRILRPMLDAMGNWGQKYALPVQDKEKKWADLNHIHSSRPYPSSHFVFSF
jgi:hypothetical protein